MGNPVGLAVTLRTRIRANEVHNASGVIDPSVVLAMFGDIAAELMIRLDGDEGIMRGFQQVELLGPVFVGDYLEASGVITKIGATSRQVAFEARKVISLMRVDAPTASAAEALADPIVVCRAVGTCLVPRAQQRRPKLILPALPGSSIPPEGRLPEGHVVLTPPPYSIITPPRETPPEVMLVASIVGGGVTREHSLHIPVSPEEIAEEAKRCRDAGACLVHLGFDPRGIPSDTFLNHLKNTVSAIRSLSDVLISVSTVAPGAPELASRLAAAELGVDLVSILGGSCNYGDDTLLAPRAFVRECIDFTAERNVHSIIDCLDIGHIDEALSLVRDKIIRFPRFHVTVGIPGALSGIDDSVKFVAARAPKNTPWFVAGVGRHQRRATEAAMRLGGNVRVGLADNIFLRKGVLAENSAIFVDRSATFARSVGRQPVEPSRARELLSLDQPVLAPEVPEVELAEVSPTSVVSE